MNKIFLIFLVFFNVSVLFSQSYISGKINDNQKQPIAAVSIVLKKENDENIISYTFSDDNGMFQFKNLEIGKYTLTISGLSYKNEVVSQESVLNNIVASKIIFLEDETFELNEVVIESEKAIVVKKDTIVFDAKKFAQGNEQVVEDLLKKIPGLNVTADGTIKVGNQEVEKIMIDGDDFFEQGYKVLTKNMPASPIDKIEVLRRYSSNKLLKGIENSNKVALNLKLSDNAKRQWFGNMSLGYGLVSENRYELRSNLMNFGKINKFYFLTNLNNIGEDATGDINNLIIDFRQDDSSNIGDDQRANSLLDLNSFSPNLKRKRVLFNNAEMVSLNAIFTVSTKVKLKTLAFFNSDEIDLFNNNFYSFTVGNDSFQNTEKVKLRKKQITGFAKIGLTYDITKTQTLEFTGKYKQADEKDKNNLIFNQDLIDEKLSSNNQLFSQKIVYTNKFRDNTVLLLTGSYINEKTPQNYKVNKFYYKDLFLKNSSINNVAQSSENKMEFAGFEAHFMDKKKNGSLFEFKFGNQFRSDKLISKFQLLANEVLIDQPENYKNDVVYNVDDLFLNGKYRYKLKKISFFSKIDFHQVFNKLETFGNSKYQNPFFVNPTIGLEWEINKKNNIQTSYSYNTTNTTILDVYDQYIHTGFRSFSKGTAMFNQLDATKAMINYTFGGWTDKFFTNAILIYSKNIDFISTNTNISPNYFQSEKIIIKDREFVTFSSNIDRYITAISSNLKFSFSGTKSNYKNIVNNSDLRKVKNTNFDCGLELRSGFKGFFNYDIGTKYKYNEISTNTTNKFTDNVSFLDLSFIFSDKFNIQLQTERYFFGNLDKQNNTYYFADLDTRYTVKENKLTFSLSGQNLFNTEVFRSYSITDISMSKSEFRLQPRYVLLKMEYRF
jgi:hypothetical protein